MGPYGIAATLCILSGLQEDHSGTMVLYIHYYLNTLVINTLTLIAEISNSLFFCVLANNRKDKSQTCSGLSVTWSKFLPARLWMSAEEK